MNQFDDIKITAIIRKAYERDKLQQNDRLCYRNTESQNRHAVDPCTV